MQQINTVKQALENVGGLSNPSKMPGFSYSIPAERCKTGSKLREIEGSTCHKCYAMKGAYGWQSTKNALQRRFDILSKALIDPETEKTFIDSFVFLMEKRKTKFFRWHDSGDLIDRSHFSLIVAIAEKSPNTIFWLPTREPSFIHGKIPKNLIVRLSATMVNGKAPTKTAQAKGVLTSTVKKTGYTCPADKQNNECQDCRICWDSSVADVSYKLH